MAKFKDKSGYEWTIELTVGLVEDIHKITDVNLDLLLEDAEQLVKLFQKKPQKLVEIMWVICEDEANSRKVDPKVFGKLFNRETLDNATNALIEGLVCFYPRASAGNALKKKLPQILAKMDAEIEKEAELNIDKVLSNTHTN